MSGKEAEAKTKSPHGKTSRWMVVALLVAAAAFVFRVIAPQTVGEQVRRHLEQTFRDHYPNLEISVGRGHYDPKRGLVFSDIRISVPEETGSSMEQETASIAEHLGLASNHSRELVRIERVVVVAHADLQKLLDKFS